MKRLLVVWMILTLLLTACAPAPAKDLPDEYARYRNATYVEAEIGTHVLTWEGEFSDEKKAELLAEYEERCTPIVLKPGECLSIPVSAPWETIVWDEAYGYDHTWSPYDLIIWDCVHNGELLVFCPETACYVFCTTTDSESKAPQYFYYVRVMIEE